MADIETTAGIEPEDEATRWLTSPPPPPPAADGPVTDHTVAGGTAPADAGRKIGAGSPATGWSWQGASLHVRAESPWLVTSAGVLVALGAYWVASVISAFEHGHLTAQERVLRILGPGSFGWVLGAVVATALFSAGRRFELQPAKPGPLRAPLAMALVAAGAVAGACAAMSAVVELANFGHGVLGALASLLGYLGTLVLAVALVWWANREHQETLRAH